MKTILKLILILACISVITFGIFGGLALIMGLPFESGVNFFTFLISCFFAGAIALESDV